ncbi:DUF4123 domain-containing protein [Luteimonas sp. SJ-92]|uniref:DUF4123 domain-containing protein n=1 Tax=Luteimonas salinisoli TaxID=2752307 RepID=A0A853JGF8_9GAMM|nr:DUF4123 domain-containing protein [Luteimonas salinisoli]NZA28503.1 DUF4123 domain-containing protein [Luteimonas salinisoli]
MNPLPEAWTQTLDGANEIHRFVLLDGAMQHELGQALRKRRYAGHSFFDQESEDAQGLGPWLLDAEQAQVAGIDGIARGVTWLAGTCDSSEAFRHLQPWIVTPFPDGVKRGYLRLGDGRVLRAILEIWNPRQRAAFCLPWRQVCCADRDGHGYMLPLPSATEVPRINVSPLNVSPLLDKRQYQALLDSSAPDVLLHELKGYVAPHTSLSQREAQHAMATKVIEKAKAMGYEDPTDQISLIGWCLERGASVEELSEQRAVRDRLRGDMLWDVLMPSELRSREGSHAIDASPA